MSLKTDRHPFKNPMRQRHRNPSVIALRCLDFRKHKPWNPSRSPWCGSWLGQTVWGGKRSEALEGFLRFCLGDLRISGMGFKWLTTASLLVSQVVFCSWDFEKNKRRKQKTLFQTMVQFGFLLFVFSRFLCFICFARTKHTTIFLSIAFDHPTISKHRYTYFDGVWTSPIPA